MKQRRDRLNIGGREVYGESVSSPAESTHGGPARRFLSVWFRCCHVYGRMYRNDAETHYVGRCPRCGSQVTAGIGPDGTPRRMFEAR